MNLQLRYLQEISLYSITTQKQSNGAVLETYTLVQKYNAQLYVITNQMRTLMNSVKPTDDGSIIRKTYRIVTPNNTLETFLLGKLSPVTDNISRYVIEYKDEKYKIIESNANYIGVELI